MPVALQLLGLAAWLGITFVAAIIGSVASINAPAFYGQLTRPAWAPPAWIFGPVWTVLYLSMGVAAWLVWRIGGLLAARTALLLFVVQLVCNALWSWLFFAWHQGGLAMLDILVLWTLVAATTVAFWRLKPIAGGLLIPYLLWVSFASVLNFAIWQLNPQLLR